MIDWNEQWELFAPGFKDGYLPLSLGGVELKLLPGPGFGDLSHETTQLMIEYLNNVPMESVIDIGCGSGILSLAAKALGASKVTGIDICVDSLEHAKQNAEFNHLTIDFCLPENCKKVSNATLLMNMIYSEQQVAWESLSCLHACKGDLVISGLLKSHKKQAITFWKAFGWNFFASKTKEQWSLIHFKKV